MLYGATIALGAFLLFLLQPIAAKAILPWFGGSAAVWSTCLLFFQAVLLVGYVYANWLDRRLAPRTQSRTHIGLLALSVLILPVVLNLDWKPRGTGDPAVGILTLLAGTIGLPYFLLSTTGPLLQAWYREIGKGAVPYRFYALSNAGSLLALLSYPVVVEPFLSRRSQAMVWLSGYALYLVFTGWLALSRQRSDVRPMDRAVEETPRPSWGAWTLWVALGACASILLISITSHLTQNLAPMPLLWVVPLGVYLLSFIVCFSHDRAYWRLLWLPFAVIAVAGMAYTLFGVDDTPHLAVSLSVFTVGLFVCCMFCHGELARTKPDARHLTSFYVACALGGAIGSVFAALLAPRIFAGNYELPFGLVACAFLVLAVIYRQVSARRWGLVWLPAAGAFVALLAAFSVQGIRELSSDARVAVRNFYGALRVSDVTSDNGETYRELVHGTIIHSAQLLDPVRRCEPITYYGRESGIGDLFDRPSRPAFVRVGVIGLGAGTLAAYGHSGDYFTFYEINPIVAGLANTEFTFLRECGARVDVAMGDARLTLEREPSQQFDILVMDAFSGDSVPVHLLTQEAFEVYFRHLKDSGVLAVHISNAYVDLQPVLERLARHFGKDLLLVEVDGDDNLLYGSLWGLISAPGGLESPEMTAGAEDVDVPPDNEFLWTDDFSSVWKVLKWR